MSELTLLTDCLKDVTKERDDLADALKQAQGKVDCSAAIEKGAVRALSTAAEHIEVLEAALKPFSHDDLCCEMGGNAQGGASIVFQRNTAKLSLDDFRSARQLLVGDRK